MKNLLLTLMLLFVCSFGFTQTNFTKEDLPAYYIQNGDTLGVLLTIQQLQKLDNDVELVSLLKKKGINCDSTIKKYVCVVNDYGKQIALLETKISKLDEIISGKNDLINNLKLQVANYQADLDRANVQLIYKDQMIKNQDKRIRKLKVQRALTIGGCVFGTAVGFLVGFFVMPH
jgi:predicted RNase H-like nuclease (RuvC/YqgF family)